MKYFLLWLLVIPGIQLLSQNTIEFRLQPKNIIDNGLFDPENGDRMLIRGNFNGWSGNHHVLTNPDSSTVYAITLDVGGDSGMICNYKYVVLKANGMDLWEKKPNSDSGPHGNRVLILTGKPQKTAVATYDFDKYYLPLIGREVIFTVEEMQADFRIFRKTLEEEHCCLYDYTPKADFDKLFEKQYTLINGPKKPNEFFRILTPITAKVGCGHTAVYMPAGYWESNPTKLFPLQVKLVAGKVVKFKTESEYLVVMGSYLDTVQVPVGSVIQEINGKPVSEIIEEIRMNYSADAFNPYFIDSQIGRRFPLLYGRRWGFPDKFVVTYALPGRKTTETKTLVSATDQQARQVIFRNFQHPPLGFEIISEKNTALLTIPTFSYYDRVTYFKSFIDSCFSLIEERDIKNLILDVRENDGGDPFCAASLFSYLQNTPTPYFSQPYGKYAELNKPILLPENHFKGNLFVFIDGRCFSTNAHFCSLLKYHQLGSIIGTPSGGTYTCNAGKNTVKHLENTGIQLYFGRSSFATAVEGMDKSKPIMPDYRIFENYNDILSGKDLFMDIAFDLIQSESQTTHN